MHFLRVVFLVFSFALLSACSLGVSPAAPEAPSPEVSEPDAPPAFSPCENNTECQGGEVCRDLECRTSCEGNDECEGFYGVCDEESSICVACMLDEDCEDNERCSVQKECAFFCSDDDACAATEFCDLQSGACEERQCEANSDCQGGFRCDTFQCVSIDEVLCEAGSIFCEENNVVTCSQDGTEKEVVTCGENNICVAADEGASCQEVVCDANSIGCIDDDNAFLCNVNGTEKTTLPCGASQFCQAGVCRDEICTPQARSCDGNLILECDDVGASQTALSCLDESLCNSENGCQCTPQGATASCVARICVPGSGQCVGAGVRVCNDEGSGFSTPTDCAAQEQCTAGTCAPLPCTPGELLCAADVLLSCNQAGTAYDEDDCAAAGTFCSSDGTARCQAQVCEPGVASCTLDGTGVELCDERGSSSNISACDNGEGCVDGVCIPQLCLPDTTRCEGPVVASCNSTGSAETLTSCSEGSLCTDGVCVEQACVPQCAARVCGVDPVCGESCGTCLNGETCSPDQRCVADAVFDPEILFQLAWSTADFDLDLRLAKTGLCDDDALSYALKNPDWDGNGASSDADPILDIDDLSGYGPENITWTSPADGSYLLAAHFYSTARTGPATVATLRVLQDNQEVARHELPLAPRDVFIAAVTVSDGVVSVDFNNGLLYGDFSGICQSSCGTCSENGYSCVSELNACVDSPTPVPTCTETAECPDTEICAAGFCVVPAATCNAHEDCGDTGLCVDNGCVEAPGCSSNVDCPPESFCSAIFPGIPIGFCAIGCNRDSECAQNERCNDSGQCI